MQEERRILQQATVHNGNRQRAMHAGGMPLTFLSAVIDAKYDTGRTNSSAPRLFHQIHGELYICCRDLAD